jgi:predicted nucleotidyltransferase
LELIETHADELCTLGAQRIGVFGSFARGETRAESSVDVYLEFTKGRKPYDNFFAISELLEGLFGRPINLVPDDSLSERKARIILPTVRYATLKAFPSGSESHRSRSREILKRQPPAKQQQVFPYLKLS